MVMPYHLHMPSYFLETFTEYPYLDDFQYLDSNVKIETLLENSIDLINYRKGKLDWIFKEYIRL